MTTEIEIRGYTFRIGKMEPRQQFHVGRRVSPVLATMGGAIMALLDDKLDKAAVFGELMASIGPSAEALAGLSDETCDYVLDACLHRVQRFNKDSASWHAIYVKGSRMFADIDLAIEMRLVSESFKLNLSGFFGELSGGVASSLSATEADQAPRAAG